MKDLILTVKDRILLLNFMTLLQGGRIKMMLAKKLVELIEFNTEEINYLELRDTPDGHILWNPAKENAIFTIDLTPDQAAVLVEVVDLADKAERITLEMMPLVEKIDALVEKKDSLQTVHA